MNKRTKHIALLLFGIFFFPILFQSFHIVWHHSHSYKCEHTLCAKTITNTDLYSNGHKISKTEKTCPICEYQFSINDLPMISFLKAVIPVFACIYNKVATQQPYYQVFVDKTPRAPPIYIA